VTEDENVHLTSDGNEVAPGLARDLSILALRLQDERDPSHVAQMIVDATTTNIPHARWAGITLVERGRFRTPVQAGGTVVARIDDMQYEFDEGPCVRATVSKRAVRSNDLATDPRWPIFGPAASAVGVRAMLSFQLFVESDAFGALNLYSDRPDVFDDDDEQVGLLLAAHAGVALADARQIAQMHLALESRDVIGRAKGILMERYKIDDQAAFELLVAASHRTHRKLRDVADDLSTTGALGLD
jgi:GAF domain-containing protein